MHPKWHNEDACLTRSRSSLSSTIRLWFRRSFYDALQMRTERVSATNLSRHTCLNDKQFGVLRSAAKLTSTLVSIYRLCTRIPAKIADDNQQSPGAKPKFLFQHFSISMSLLCKGKHVLHLSLTFTTNAPTFWVFSRIQWDPSKYAHELLPR